MQRKFLCILSLTFFFIAIAIHSGFSQETNIPDWLKRTEFSVYIETDKKPNLYFQTVQPLYQDELKENTVFIQPRVSLSNEELTYNLGFGYRRLVSENLMLGANIFGDYDDTNSHCRVGAGIEAFGQILEARLNTYFGTTPRRIVEQSGGNTTYEKAVDGMDLEIGASIPYIPWLKVYGSGFWYDFKNFKDKYGWKTRLEAKLNDGIKMEFYTWDDNKGKTEYGARIRCSFAFNGVFDFSDNLKISKKPFPKKDLSKQALSPVERSFNITVEKWVETATTTIEVVRGD